MAEAAAVGFDGPPAGGPLSEPTDGPLGPGPGGPSPGAVIPGDPSFSSALIPGTTGFSGPSDFGSPLAPQVGSINTLSGPMIGPSYGMGPLGGPGLAGLSMDTMGGPLAPGDMMLGTTGFVDPISGILGPGPFGLVSEYGSSSTEPIVEFFEDPSLYDDYRQNQDPPEIENNLNTFLINGSGDFGKTFENFTINDTLTINFTFDEPSSTYSVTRSSFYEYTSTATTTRLTWDSRPSTSSQTVNETESNGNFSNAQVISRARFKVASNSDVGDDSHPWVKIQNGWINNGVDLFKVDLQAGETLIVDVDYGDSYSDSFNSYVTLYNSSQVSVAENDDSAISLGGSGSSGTADSYISYTSTTTESFYIFVEDSPKNSNSSTRGDYVVNLSISPTSSSTGLGTSSTSSVGGKNELPYIINFTEDTNNHSTNSFRSDLVSSIRYTDSVSGSGSEVFIIAGNGTDSTIWLWDDLSEGYGISTNELTLVASLPNFNNDNLTGSEITFGTI